MAVMDHSPADCPALAAVKALAASVREMADAMSGQTATLADHGRLLDTVESKVDDTNRRVRTLEQSWAQIKDLLVRALDR